MRLDCSTPSIISSVTFGKAKMVSALIPNVEMQTRVRISSTDCFFPFNQPFAKMLSRAVRGGYRALPLRRKVNVYVPLAKRNVTTDAASSHAEKEHVPEVR